MVDELGGDYVDGVHRQLHHNRTPMGPKHGIEEPDIGPGSLHAISGYAIVEGPVKAGLDLPAAGADRG